MEIQTSTVNTDIKQQQKRNGLASIKSGSTFADELKANNFNNTEEQVSDCESKKEETADNKKNDTNVDEAVNELTETVSKVNQSEDKSKESAKDIKKDSDKDNKGADMINNDYNIENKDKLSQMLPNMNFSSNGQPFSSFMNNGNNGDNSQLSTTAQDLAEEAAILSTMAENIAMANKANDYQNNISEKISENGGIKKVNTQSNMVTDIIVQFDSVVMNETDVEMFNSLVNGTPVNLNDMSAEAAQKSARVSKTLSDLLAKAMEKNKPVRIEFDNGISVIIRISRDGKLSADFLPSTQVAEAYLKENLPLLKQKFSEQNLDYESLNQRERRNQDRDQNRKKGQENE